VPSNWVRSPGQKLEKSNKILENVKSIRAGLL
jgi:hypothetical protein